jgi:hypothetical protein
MHKSTIFNELNMEYKNRFTIHLPKMDLTPHTEASSKRNMEIHENPETQLNIRHMPKHQTTKCVLGYVCLLISKRSQHHER